MAGKTGQRRKSLKAKILEGEKNRDRLVENPVAPKDAPTMPPTLRSDHAKAAWSEAIESLELLGILSSIDRKTIEMYALTYSWMVEAHELAEKNGLIVGLRRNPAIAEFNNQREALLKLAKELGFTPTARSKINLTPKDPNNLLEKFGIASG